ncbi:MAG: serine hydrolase [Chloroflexi bacterium]|nr:serine hydrolase [Chloroflexota bacterium]
MLDPIIESITEQIECETAALCVNDRVVGASVGIVRDQELVWNRGFGFADLESGRPPDLHTVFRIASVTKTFTATALFQLRDEGKLSLDDPLLTYVPEFANAKARGGSVEGVTLRRLLCHHSGLMAEAPGDEPFWSTMAIPSIKEIIAATSRIEIVIEQDAAFKYSNVGFALLGEVVTRVAGRRYEDYVMEEVLRPLGMTSTVFELDGDLGGRMATGYMATPYEDSATVVPDVNLAGYASAGQLYSTVDDLAKWVSFQFSAGAAERDGKQVLRGQSIKEMQRPRVMGPNWESGYGLPWIARRVAGRVIVGHPGFTYGFRADVSFDVERRLGVIALLNTVPDMPSVTDAILQRVFEAEDRRAAPTVFEKPAPTPEGQRDFLGLYVDGLGLTLRTEYRDACLRIVLAEGNALGFAPGRLQPTGDADVFVAQEGRWIGERVIFKRSDAGAVNALDLGPFRFRKMVRAGD